MPLFECTTELMASPDVVFAYLSNPANLVEVSPPEFHMRLVEGPEVLSVGATIIVSGRRWGVSQSITSRVLVYDPPRKLVDEMVKGPFKKFKHTHELQPLDSGTRMFDCIEYESPGGVLGLVLTNARIQSDLFDVFALRTKVFEEKFGKRVAN